MCIRPGLEDNLEDDYIESYNDLSNGFGGRNKKMANYVLVSMLDGLGYDWKQPLMYFSSEGPVNGETLQSMILCVLYTAE